MSSEINRQAKEVYTTREAAELLGVSLRTIQLWVESGLLNAWKTAGGHRRISYESLHSVLGEQQGALNKSKLDRLTKILIIEDDIDLLELYTLRIQMWDLPIQVLTASNGYEGLIKIGEHMPDIVIVDLILPNMNGFELINTIKKSDEYKKLEIIVVSSLTEEEIASRGGIDKSIQCFEKPVSFEKLLQRVVKNMSRKSGLHGMRK